jgi:hypothetical protein
MATMVVQLGLATMPFGIVRRASSFTPATTSGTSGSIRNAEELSTTTTPAAASRGACSFEAVAPMDISAMSTPARSAVAMSSTSISPPAHGRRRPAERDDAK